MLKIYTSQQIDGDSVATAFAILRRGETIQRGSQLTVYSQPVTLLEAQYRAAYAALYARLAMPSNERTVLHCERELHAELTRFIPPENADRWRATYSLLFALPEPIEVRLSGEFVGQYLADMLAMQIAGYAPTPVKTPVVPRAGVDRLAVTLRQMLRPDERERLASLLILA